MTPWDVRPGVCREGEAVTFGIVSRHATAIDLCLVEEIPGGADQTIRREKERLSLQRGACDLWHVRIPRCPQGQRYGFRVQGPWEPAAGHVFNPHRLLVDPSARALSGGLTLDAALSNVPPDHPAYMLDSLSCVPLSVVPGDAAPLQHARPRIDWADTVLYEAHVKGLTVLHPDVAPLARGRYAGLRDPAIVSHLKRLGITTLELMPVQYFMDEPALVRRGGVNYWGYNPLAWSVPSPRYALQDAATELREAIDQLHAEGIEVVVDVVFNHTAEGGLDDLVLSWRGIDNVLWYRAGNMAPWRASNVTGCGNAVAFDESAVIQACADALRHWASFYGVDGFRLDLASTLSRRGDHVDPDHPLWTVIRQDPLLGTLKWIVEPWDCGADGYQLGRYPPWLMQWNDQFRDQVRRVMRGDPGQLSGLAKRMAGSWDIFTRPGQHMLSGVNYVAAHDGFSLLDTVSYSHKHNLANGEDNQDGHDDNCSDNAGIEGPSDDPAIVAVRLRRRCNAMLLLAMAQGIPMLSHGDETGHSRRGNNNAYCHDSALNWLDWAQADTGFMTYVAALFRLRRQWGIGRICDPAGRPWQEVNRHFRFLRSDAHPMEEVDWQDWHGQQLVMEAPAHGWRLLCNFSAGTVRFEATDAGEGNAWQCVADTARPACLPGVCHGLVTERIDLAPHSLVVLQRHALRPSG